MAMSKPANTYRGIIAGLSYAVSAGKRSADDPELLEARRGLRGQRLVDHIEEVLAGSPPLTPEQMERAASVLISAAQLDGGSTS